MPPRRQRKSLQSRTHDWIKSDEMLVIGWPLRTPYQLGAPPLKLKMCADAGSGLDVLEPW